ncbi:sulfite exporter TauE/SafE family protein [Candidatus Peregrinibacteria bacterium]|nr:sulfite exporter TauE/SafE family protein [Candidatus Peregrinibacteria bacterium]
MIFDHFFLVLAVTTLASIFSIMFGGGSFILFPTLFLLGIDAKVVVATNLTAVLAQLITGTIVFNKKKKVNFSVAKSVIPFIVTGAIIGVFILKGLESELIKKLVASAIIIFATISLFNRDKLLRNNKNVSKKSKMLGGFVSFFNGIYQTTISAGSGTTSTLILVYFYGLKLKDAIGTRQIISFASVSIATSIVVYSGLVDWIIFFPMLIGRGIGALIGSHIIIKTKSTILSYLFSIVVILLALKILFF